MLEAEREKTLLYLCVLQYVVSVFIICLIMYPALLLSMQLSNYSSFEGVLYCKPHFDQLFKMTGSLDKSFEGDKLLCCDFS